MLLINFKNYKVTTLGVSLSCQNIKTSYKVNGQIGGFIKMLDEDTDPEKILTQFKAAQKGLDKDHFLLLDEAYRKALAIPISETVEACPGNCGNECAKFDSEVCRQGADKCIACADSCNEMAVTGK